MHQLTLTEDEYYTILNALYREIAACEILIRDNMEVLKLLTPDTHMPMIALIEGYTRSIEKATAAKKTLLKAKVTVL